MAEDLAMSGAALRWRALGPDRRPLEFAIERGRLVFGGSGPLDVDGGFVLPGLVDAHTHLVFGDGQRQGAPPPESIDALRARHAAVGQLLLRDMGSTLATPPRFRADDGLPRVLLAGRCVVPEDREPFVRTSEAGLVDEAVRQVRSGASWVKIFTDWAGWPHGTEPEFGLSDCVSYSLPVLEAAVEAVHAEGGRVAAHAFGREAPALAIAAGVDSIEHGWHIQASQCREMARRRIAWVPTLAIAPAMLHLARRDRRPEQIQWIEERILALSELLPIAVNLGVPVLTGTDWFPVVSVADEVDALVAAGLSMAQAVTAASTGAREFLGQPGLEAGAPADFVWFERDPLRHGVRHPDRIVLGGREVRAAQRA